MVGECPHHFPIAMHSLWAKLHFLPARTQAACNRASVGKRARRKWAFVCFLLQNRLGMRSTGRGSRPVPCSSSPSVSSWSNPALFHFSGLSNSQPTSAPSHCSSKKGPGKVGLAVPLCPNSKQSIPPAPRTQMMFSRKRKPWV